MNPNALDTWVMSVAGSLTHRSEIFDLWIEGLKGNQLLKGGVVMAVFWWLWFGSEPKVKQAREVLLATLLGALAAAATARIAVILLPFRLRPLHDPDLHYQLPFGTSPEALDGMSSFPSDHAAVFFGLAAGLLFLSRPIGIAMLGYVALFIALPRIYTGMHYPTDILAGAFIGVVFATLANRLWRESAMSALARRWVDEHPSSFYSAFFLLAFQVATLFDGARGVLAVGFRTLRLLVHR
jgi:undecaprenyl-diphosphatase